LLFQCTKPAQEAPCGATAEILSKYICAAAQVAVRAGHISPPHCTASGNGLQAAIAGARASFTVQARDAHANALSVGGAEIVVLLRGADGQQVSALVTGA
jgi:hypothetical protein